MGEFVRWYRRRFITDDIERYGDKFPRTAVVSEADFEKLKARIERTEGFTRIIYSGVEVRTSPYMVSGKVAWLDMKGLVMSIGDL